MVDRIIELTDEYIIGDMRHSARVFVIIGVVVLLIGIVAFVITRKKGVPFSRVAILFIFAAFLAGGSVFIGIRTLQGLKDFSLVETVVTDKKCIEEKDRTDKRTDGKEKTVKKYYVYFENGFPSDTSHSGYLAANVGDHVYIANIHQSGATQYYYGEEYLYTGAHLVE